MKALRDYVNWGIAHSDIVGKAEGVPLVMENCKRNKKMKQLEVYGESVQDGTPSPEAPVEVESVGEPCIRNWFDKNLFLHIEDYNVATNYGFYTAKYIEGLKPGTKYNIVIERLNDTTPKSAGCTVLISGGVFSVTAGKYTTIGHASSATETNNSPYTSDENGRLTIGISTSTTQEQLDSLWENTNVYLYEDGDETTVYKVPVTVRGKNLFNCSSADSLYNGSVSGNTFKQTATGVAWTPHNTSSFVHLDLGFASYYVGKTLVASFDADVQNEETFNDTAFVVCDADGSNRKSLTGSHVWNNGHFYVRSLLAEGDYGEKHLTLRLYMRDAIAYQTYEFKNIMVTESDTDIPFEPYNEPVTTDVYLNEPLRKIGEYADVVDFQKKRVMRNTYCNILDGTGSTGSLSILNTDTFTGLRITYRGDMEKYVMPKDKGLQVSHYCLCNRYPVVSTAYRGDCTLSGSTTAMNIFDIIDFDFLSVEDWTEHMKALNDAGTPIRVVHAVATPYEESIDCELPMLMTKTSVIEIDTGILPSNMKGKYIKR